ncbi:MAG: hypothetical protein WEB00_07960 [Dehalococcoidia bacterium]
MEPAGNGLQSQSIGADLAAITDLCSQLASDLKLGINIETIFRRTAVLATARVTAKESNELRDRLLRPAYLRRGTQTLRA